MKYTKPVIVAQNKVQGVYALDCSKTMANKVCGSCQFPK